MFWTSCPGFSPQKLRSNTASVWAEQRVHAGSECHQAGKGVCQTLCGLLRWTQRWDQLHGQTSPAPLHSALWLLWWTGNLYFYFKCLMLSCKYNTNRMFCLNFRWKCGTWPNVNVCARSKHMKVLSGEWLSATVELPFSQWVLVCRVNRTASC